MSGFTSFLRRREAFSKLVLKLVKIDKSRCTSKLRVKNENGNALVQLIDFLKLCKADQQGSSAEL